MKFLRLAAWMLVLAAIFLLLFRLAPEPTSRTSRLPAPWEVSVAPDGASSEVLGIRLGETTLGSARSRFGGDLQLALIEQADGALALEAYAARVEAGFVTGSVVLTSAPDPVRLQAFRERAGKPAPQPSGSRRWTLAAEDQAAAFSEAATSLTFIPSIRLDEAMIHERFGPSAAMRPGGTAKHYPYPAIGLDITVEESGRSVLQYVAPANFARLAAPLDKTPDKEPAAR